MNERSPVLQSGDTFGSWTALKFSHSVKGQGSFWLFQCVCGFEKPLLVAAVRAGRSKQCKGCQGRAFGKRYAGENIIN